MLRCRLAGKKNSGEPGGTDTHMQLQPDEEAILAGEAGETRQQMIEILIALGKVFSADRLVPIQSAQVSGASYKTIGEAGLEWLTMLDAQYRIKIP